MAWKKINNAIEMWEEPVLGTETLKGNKKFMSLCIDPSSKNPYKGIARQVTERKGHEDNPEHIDLSKLVIVESKNLLKWKIIGDFEIKGLSKHIKYLPNNERFIGLEDPDILIDEKGLKHVYFSVPLMYPDHFGWDIYIGHAIGKNLKDLTIEGYVLGPKNEKITGFKEVMPTPNLQNGSGIYLTEIEIVEDRLLSAIAAVKSNGFGGKWDYMHLALDPRNSKHNWCKGHVSPCRVLPKNFIDPGNNLFAMIINGRELPSLKNGRKIYGNFLPGLALYNSKTVEISWVAEKPLFKDPKSTAITFASEFIQTEKNKGILYAHPNDSFVRAYKLDARILKGMLPS